MQSARKSIFEITKFMARYSKSSSNWEYFIRDSFGNLGTATEADRIGILQFDRDKNKFFNPEIFWTGDGIAPYATDFMFDSTEGYQWDHLVKQLSDDKHVTINSADFAKNHKANIPAKSTLLIPIMPGDSLGGCLIIEHFLSDRSWSEEDIDALRIFSGILAISIEHRKAKDALNESEGLFEILSGFSEGILIVDWNGNILHANKAMLKHADAERINELKEANIKYFLHPETQAFSMTLLERSKRCSGGTFYDHKVKTKQGEIKYLACAGTQTLYKGKARA